MHQPLRVERNPIGQSKKFPFVPDWLTSVAFI
ncbi:hypothetical protein CBM2599_B50321 [Cupriavidus taiwanensis]|nr:hypothetical protein CBM2600_B10672 [Cupriavidus taiwanensis]SOY96389.1 hypothetical protein CBM2599_B50321 [Cupriavidus taiwanensis]